MEHGEIVGGHRIVERHQDALDQHFLDEGARHVQRASRRCGYAAPAAIAHDRPRSGGMCAQEPSDSAPSIGDDSTGSSTRCDGTDPSPGSCFSDKSKRLAPSAAISIELAWAVVSEPVVCRDLAFTACGFPRRLRLDRQRVDGAGEFRRQRRINHAVALDPALPFEGRRHNINPEMRLAARPVAGVALMQM